MKYSRCCRPKGLTLVEVIASLALLSTVLITVLTAWTRHSKQVDVAFRKSEAIQLLDQQIASWYSADSELPVNQSGVFTSKPEYTWQTKLLSAKTTNNDWKVATLEILVFDQRRRDKPLAKVELLVDLWDELKPENN